MSNFRAYLNNIPQPTFRKIPKKAAQNRAAFVPNCTEWGKLDPRLLPIYDEGFNDLMTRFTNKKGA